MMRVWLARWWWIPAALVAFVVFDQALHYVYFRGTDIDSTVRGEAILEALDEHPETGLWVLGDSSGRYGVNTNILTDETKIPSWNLATFHGGFASQVTLLDREVKRGRKLRAIVFVHTENGQLKYVGHEGPEITLAYFLTPHAVSYWYQNDLNDASTSLQWSFALVSPSYRDGPGLERFLVGFAEHPWRETSQKLAKRWPESLQQYNDHFVNRGHTRGTDKNGPGLGEFDYFIRVILEDPGWKFYNHKDVDEWNERLLAITDKHNIKVFFALTPRMEKILRHPNWPEKVGIPIRRWAEALHKRHPSFELLAPDPFSAKADEFYDTADHLNARGAERYSRWIAEQLEGRL